jgi:hypothetical protein
MLEGMTTTSNGNQTRDYPSGFLTVQIPHYNSTTEFAAFACSVDARWALGNNIATNVLDYSYISDSLQHGEVLSTMPHAPGNRFLPVPDGTWSKISMDLDWLNTLTPLLNSSSEAEARNMPGWTSYASLLSDVGMDNGTSLVVSWGDIRSSLETTLAVLVPEGLARIGFSANGGSMKYESDSSSILNIPKTTTGDFTNDALNSLLRDDGNAVLLPKGVDPENLTKVHWGITISGYAYKADSIGYYLAIAVLFAHIVLAFLHFLYSFFYTGQSSDAWGSFEDLMVLSHSSQPDPQGLRNTSSGIECHYTIQRKVRIRVADGDKRVRGHEELQLLFDSTPEVGYKKVVPGKAYGAVD